MYIRGILGVDQETDDFVPGGTIPQAEMVSKITRAQDILDSLF